MYMPISYKTQLIILLVIFSVLNSIRNKYTRALNEH